MELLFPIINLILILVLYGLVIFTMVKLFGLRKDFDQSIAEIKSKIGSVIRDINAINAMDYKVDMEQNADIAALRRRA